MSERKGATVKWAAAASVAVIVLAVAAPGRADAPSGEPQAAATYGEPPAEAEAGVLTVDEAVALALQSNRGVAVAAMNVDRAEQRVQAARTKRLPSLELQATGGTTLNTIRVSYPEGAFGNYPPIGPIPATDTIVEAPRTMSGNMNATLAQPLTQLHKIGLNTKLNELGRDAEREKLRAERAKVAAEVREAYYQIVQGESALRAAEELVGVYRELDREVGQQVAVEVALKSDGLSVKAQLASQEYKLAALRGDVDTGRERLNHLLGRELDQPFRVVAVTDASLEEVDLRSALATAVEHRPDLAQARLAVEQADTDRRLKKAESIPDVSLAVVYQSFFNVDLLPRNVAIAGLQLKWEPFDWGRKGKERAEKTIQLEQAKSQAKDAESLARLEVASAFRKLHEARLYLEAERLSRDAATEKLRVTAVRHRQDAALLKDLLEAQASMSSAHAEYDRALTTFWTAKADFQKALGEEQ
jgi:outer membrane protein